jgi:hypothetical protein
LASRYPVKGYFRRGKWVRSTTRPYRGRKANSGGSSVKSKSKHIAITLTISGFVVIGGITLGPTVISSGGTVGSTSSEVGGEGHYAVNGSAENVDASFSHAEAALSVSGFGSPMRTAFDTNCASNSYGQVQTFLQSNPCKWLARAYVAIPETTQDGVLVAFSWVDMPTLLLAEEYKSLVDKQGTGNITELSREYAPYKDVAYSGNYYLSGIAGTAVWNVEFQPVGPISSTVIQTIMNDSRQ